MKNPHKHSPILYREVLKTIERICVAENPDETDKTLNDIYIIAHTFSADCKNLHPAWKVHYEEIKEQLDDARI